METLDTLNKRLIELYGVDPYNNAKFRISWSNDQLEKRNGRVNQFHGKMFVRTVVGVHEWPKYPFYKDRHILEMCCINTNPELITRFTYEPLYTFEDKDGNALPLDWEMIEFFMHCFLYGAPATKSDYDTAEAKHIAEEEALTYDILNNNSPYLAGKLKDGEAVFLDSRKVFSGQESTANRSPR